MGEKSVSQSGEKMSFRTVMAVVAIFLSSFAIMGDAAPGVVYNDIYAAYPNDLNAVNTIISLPQLMIVVGSLVATALLRKLSKRTVLILGMALFAVGGIFGASVDNVYYMLVMRIPYGLGMAFINVVGVAYLAEFFVDEGRRSTMVGLYNAVMALLGSVISIVAGQLAAAGWRQVYLCFWAAVPILILFVVFLPKNKTGVDGEAAQKSQSKAKKSSLGARFWVFTITFAFFDMLFCVFTFYISSFVAENALGDASFSALLISAYTLGGFLGGIVFGLVNRFAGRYSAVLCYALGVLCMIGLWGVRSQVVLLILSVAIGMAYNMALTYGYAHLPTIVPADRVDDSIGILTAAYGLGAALATYFTTGLMAVLGSPLVTPTFLAAGLLMVVCVVVEAVSARVGEKPQAASQQAEATEV